MIKEKLESMADIDIHDVDENTVATFEEAAALAGKNPHKTLEKFFKKGFNPYFRKKNGCIVKISFANNGTRLSDTVASILSCDA